MAKVVAKVAKYVKKITCKACSSVIEYTTSELSKRNYIDSQDYPASEYSLKCPGCQNKIIVRKGS